YETDIRLQPIGLCYLKAAVHKYLPDVTVVLKDYHQGWGRRTVALPRELSYLKTYYELADQSPFSTFHHYYHFGADYETIAEEVFREKPDLVGISALFSPYYREALAAAQAIKKRIAVPILFGGSHVSAMPEEVLVHDAVDYVIRGEGEKPLVDFLTSLIKNKPPDQVAGLGFKRAGKMILNETGENYPLADLPHPDISDFARERYLFEKKPVSFVITSRSCPHRCTFCSVHKTFGFKFRRRSSEDVLAEILDRYKNGVRVFDFEDDNLTYYREEMKKLCLDLIAAFPKKDVQFVAMNGISYLSLDTELLRLMKEAGFTHLNLALVSSDTTVRETTKRPHTIEKYLEVVAEASKLGFHIVSYQILGLPNETLASMIQTLTFNAQQPVLMGASLFYLTPRSPIARDFPVPSEEDVFKSRLTAMAIETDSFKRDDLYTLFITTRILNFLKGQAVTEKSVPLAKILDQAKLSDKRSRIGAELLETLLQERCLYAETPQGKKVRTHFKNELFFEVWNQLGKVTTQEGKEILL
ncbi:MAG: B12-binding domain-containing radical SAM protein, partial [Candidatus Omnitrophica bacterium]|nr:B12-binding domain-containing radical SAM protein [Candidatus Omnitrophota bacterium]